MNKKTLEEIEVKGKRVLVRADFNIPLEPGANTIAEYDHRLRAVLPTVHYLLNHRAKIILCSHLGRPGGKVVEELRLGPVAHRLSDLLGHPVLYVKDAVGQEASAAAARLGPGELLLLENLRFYPGEEKNDPQFARALASLADIFVMDAFGVAHRAHASTVGVPHYLPSVAGLLLKRELDMLGGALDEPRRPLGALLGGAKVNDKIMVLENLLPRVNALLIGGGMAVTFLKAAGHSVGRSRVETDKLEFAAQFIRRTQSNGAAFLLPTDVVVAEEFRADAQHIMTVPVTQVPSDWYIMDIGPRTVELFTRELRKCQTVIWNGPMGVFEFPAFAQGTRRIAEALASLKGAITIVGGGSTAEAVEQLGLADKMTHVSTGGGAMLEYLGHRPLPGLEALRTSL